MAYAATTLEQLKARLNERVGGHGRFWVEFEQELAINEALNLWQLLVGEFSVQAITTSGQFSDEVCTIWDPATGTTQLFNPGTAVEAPTPLSVWRVGTDVQTHTTGALYSFPKLVQLSLPDLDHGFSSWRTGSASTAEYWVPAGVNMMVFYPRPNQYLRYDYFRGDRLLNNNSDYIQLGDEEITRILDYAVWQLNIKSGTAEAFNNTEPLKQLFLLAATTRNQKLRGSQFYKDFMGSDYGEAQPKREAEKQEGGR